MPALETSRRDLFVAGGALVTLGSVAAAASPTISGPPAFVPQPLPFDPKTLGWLSEKIIVSHHDNNYVGAVKRLSAIRADVARLDMATAPVFELNGLKREELIAWNSMILHELYFAGLGSPAALGRPLAQALEKDFGSVDRWAAEFSAMGKALGGGSGWVLLTWSARDRKLTNQWAADHSMALAGGTSILALDMYEHAYHMDFGAKAAAYVDGFMKSLSWANANRLFTTIAA